ncbi:hypothetical protein B296_00052627 [Ensete ventricosum]|uniref:Uncharacterized protein n=1 Tax=Ensete ventricosum TaxID=4639 RepID=A0A426XWL7_ENSVE|nr:hypothetical protein B296_00052627 [Ensete ventricosum]
MLRVSGERRREMMRVRKEESRGGRGPLLLWYQITYLVESPPFITASHGSTQAVTVSGAPLPPFITADAIGVTRSNDDPTLYTILEPYPIKVEICVPSTSFVPRPSASITPRRSSHTLTRRATYVHHHLATVAHPRALDDASSTSEKPSCHAVAPGKLPFR